MLRVTALATLATLAANALLPASAVAQSNGQCNANCAGKPERTQCVAVCREDFLRKKGRQAVAQPFNIHSIERETGGGGGGGGRGGRN
jgi:hypothetical protein